MKNCIICKNKFKSKSNSQKLCSTICVIKHTKKYDKEYRYLHKNQFKKYRRDHKEQFIKYRKSRKELKKEYDNQYYHRNKNIIIEKNRICNKQRRKKNLNYRLSQYLKCRIWKALKGISKSARTMKLLSCSIDELKKHLEKRFKVGMSWKNYGKWHVDHIRPCASFDLSKPNEQIKCFNYKNLQPLWAKENLEKNKYYN